MNGTVNTTDLCQIAEEIVANVQLPFIHALQCVFGAIAVFSNILTLNFLWRSRVFHANLRLLLANLSFVLALYSTAMAFKAFRRLFIPVCALPMLMKSCMLQELSFSIPLHNSLVSLLALCLERVYATLRYRHYDFAKGLPFLAVFLLTCAWTGTFYVQFANYDAIPPNLWVPICETPLFGSRERVISTVISFASLEMIALIVTTFVFLYNRFVLGRMAINRAKFDLSSRFQVDQNVKLSSALFPSDLLHIISYLPAYGLLLFTSFNLSFPMSKKVWLLHLSYLYRIIYATAHSVLLITRNPTMKQQASRTLLGKCFKCLYASICGRKRRVRNANSWVKDGQDHFDQLQEVWTISYNNRQKTTAETKCGPFCK